MVAIILGLVGLAAYVAVLGWLLSGQADPPKFRTPPDPDRHYLDTADSDPSPDHIATIYRRTE